MRIALIGYGEMGQLIHKLAEIRGHEVFIAGKGEREDGGVAGNSDALPLLTRGLLHDRLHDVDVAIDFSVGSAVVGKVEACVAAGVPLVVGTTGWNGHRTEVERIVLEGDGTLVFGANFSVGVNIFYRVADYAAELIAKFPKYEAFIEEQHHSRKKDSPSGTALKLKDIVDARLNGDVGVSAVRAGSIPGTHRIGFDGTADQILLEHTARTREGFALGALMAAEWIIGKKGVYEFSDVLDEIIMSNTFPKG